MMLKTVIQFSLIVTVLQALSLTDNSWFSHSEITHLEVMANF